MNIDVCKLELLNIKLNARDSEKIRGYLSNKYENIDLLHNHDKEKFIYRYPSIQYKVVNNKAIIIGVNEGAKVVSEIGLKEDDFIIGDRSITAYEKNISINNRHYGCVDDYVKYEFISPWIALNQKNISSYRISNEMDKEEMLKKILIGNIISMSKGFGYTVKEKINCWINLKKKEVNIKGIKHTGFVGEFKVNFNIPDYLGIGKSVSKGFGTIKKVG